MKKHLVRERDDDLIASLREGIEELKINGKALMVALMDDDDSVISEKIIAIQSAIKSQ